MEASGPIRGEPSVFVPFPSIFRYSPIPYLPQAAGILVAKLFALSDLGALYLAGFSALICCSLILFAAFRALDFSWRWTWLVFLLAGMPMSLFLTGSISPDGVTISLSLLAFALALRIRRGCRPGMFAAFLAVCGALGLCKALYFLVPIALVPVALPGFLTREGFRKSLRRAGLIVAAAFVPALLWSLSVPGFLARVRAPGTDPAAQLHFMLSHPLQVAFYFIRGTSYRAWLLIGSFIGMLGWLDTPLPAALIVLYALTLIAICLIGPDHETEVPGRRERLWLGLMFLGFWLAVLVSEYLTWMKVGAEDVAGTQGRHFIPIAAIGLAAIQRRGTLTPQTAHAIDLLLWTGWSASALITAFALLLRYWA
jgi:uncharacterized membrane protein